MPNVLRGIAHTHRRQATAHRYALAELTKVMTIKDIVELRLSRQYDLDQLISLRLQVRDHAQLFEYIRSQILGLINHQDNSSSESMMMEKEQVKGIQVPETVALVRSYSEFAADAGQQLFAGKAGVEYQRTAIFFGIKLAEQRAQHRSLAGPHLSGHSDETGMTVNTVEKMRKGLTVVFAQIDKVGIGSNRERFFAESEKFTVHRELLTLSCSLYLKLYHGSRRAADHSAGIDAGLDRNAAEDIVVDFF